MDFLQTAVICGPEQLSSLATLGVPPYSECRHEDRAAYPSGALMGSRRSEDLDHRGVQGLVNQGTWALEFEITAPQAKPLPSLAKWEPFVDPAI